MCHKKLLVPLLSLLLFVIAGMFILSEETSAACPQGSYQRTCNMSSVACDANSITATCKKMDGKWWGSKLNLPCNNDIANCDGTLRCLCGGNCPSGSYRNSCWCCYFQGSSLHCYCKNMAGNSGATGLANYANCSTEIANCNGTLRCLCGSNCPSGSYKNSCWCCNFQGSTMECYCKNKKGKSVRSTLSNYSICKPGEIWNDNGMLKCNR